MYGQCQGTGLAQALPLVNADFRFRSLVSCRYTELHDLAPRTLDKFDRLPPLNLLSVRSPNGKGNIHNMRTVPEPANIKPVNTAFMQCGFLTSSVNVAA